MRFARRDDLMAQFAVKRTTPSMIALIGGLAVLALMTFVIASSVIIHADEQRATREAAEGAGDGHISPGMESLQHTRDSFNGEIYLFSIGLMFLGFWSKEDHIVMLGVIALCMFFILDVQLGHFGLIGPFAGHGGGH